MASRPRHLLALLTAAAATIVIAAGCAPSPVEPDDTDAERLNALRAAPPFDAAPYGAQWSATEARGAHASSNTVAYRATLSTSFPVDSAPADPSLDDDWAVTFPLAQQILAELRAGGWSPVSVACEAPLSPTVPRSVQIYATAPLDDDGVVAAVSVRVGTGAGEVVAEAAVPFHSEPDDPWGGAPLDDDTCLDAAAPPTDSTAAGTPLELSDVRP